MSSPELIDSAPSSPRRETDRRALMVIAEVLKAFNFKNERQFLLANGYNEALLYKIRRGIQSAGEELIALLATQYRANANFIFTGEGTLFQPEPGMQAKYFNGEGANFGTLPFVPVRAVATFVSNYASDWQHEPETTWPVIADIALKFKNGIVIEISGDSMADQIRSGSKVIAVPVPIGDWVYQSGGVYAVIYRDYFVVKRIRDNQLLRQNYLELHSDNPKGGTMSVAAADIRGMWKVVKIIDADVE